MSASQEELQQLAEAIAPENLRPDQLKAIRAFYEDDPAIARLAMRLGLSTEELLSRLETQTEPIFQVAPDYDRDADYAAFEKHAATIRSKQRFEQRTASDGRDDGAPDTIKAIKRAPKEGQSKGLIDGPKELQAEILKSRFRVG